MNNQAELISIGDELLCGQTLNTHGRDLGSTLANLGLQLTRDTTIPDQIPLIASAVLEAFERTDLVFVSGGLGPTVDDITREGLAAAFGLNIIPHPPTIQIMEERYKSRGRTMNTVAERQGLVLETAIVLPNSVGAAPGQRLERPGGKTLFVLPGPPNEFNAILNEEIIPWLQLRYTHANPKLVRIIQTVGIGESDLVAKLDADGFDPGLVGIGYYPGNGKVKIRLSAEHNLGPQIDEVEQRLLTVLAGYVDQEAPA